MNSREIKVEFHKKCILIFTVPKNHIRRRPLRLGELPILRVPPEPYARSSTAQAGCCRAVVEPQPCRAVHAQAGTFSRTNLYEIPILSVCDPSRRLMRQCPFAGGSRGSPNLISFPALVCKRMLAAMRRRGRLEGAPKCWTSSCWPLASVSLRYPSATRWPATGFEAMS
jgi:hypothetical protein